MSILSFCSTFVSSTELETAIFSKTEKGSSQVLKQIIKVKRVLPSNPKYNIYVLKFQIYF